MRTLNIARRVLEVYKDQGLWEVNKAKDGALSISRNKITGQQYSKAMETLNTLDNNGMNESDRSTIQQEQNN